MLIGEVPDVQVAEDRWSIRNLEISVTALLEDGAGPVQRRRQLSQMLEHMLRAHEIDGLLARGIERFRPDGDRAVARPGRAASLRGIVARPVVCPLGA